MEDSGRHAEGTAAGGGNVAGNSADLPGGDPAKKSGQKSAKEQTGTSTNASGQNKRNLIRAQFL
jgi:hypothetical protein